MKFSIRPHSEHFKDLFLKERTRILKVLSPFQVDIEHIGSTAIPGCNAYPIIDILISYNKPYETLSRIKNILIGLGYAFVSDFDLGIIMGTNKTSGQDYTIHIAQKGSNAWQRFVYFRNSLLKSKKHRQEYNTLRKQLSRKEYADIRDYTKDKHAFISQIIEAERENRYNENFPAINFNTHRRKYRYRTIGTGAQKIIFLSGMINPGIRDHILNELSAFFKIILFEPRFSYSLKAMAADISDFASNNNFDKPLLMGYDWGGYICQVMIRKSPELFKKVVLLRTAAPDPDLSSGLYRSSLLLSLLPSNLSKKLIGAYSRQLSLKENKEKQEMESILLSSQSYLNKATVLKGIRIALDFHKNYTFSFTDLANWQGKMMVVDTRNRHPKLFGLNHIYPQSSVIGLDETDWNNILKLKRLCLVIFKFFNS